MANYIKEYEVLGRKYGIEDFESPGEHFFDIKDTNGKRLPRFMLWAGGCGIGHAKTLTEANENLYMYIYEEMIEKLSVAETKFREIEKIVDRLGLTRNNLAYFKIKPKRGSK